MAKYKRGSLTLARQVFNTPQLIIPQDLQTVAQYLVNRANGLDNPQEYQKESNKLEPLEVLMEYSDEEQKRKYHKRIGITNDGKRGNLEVVGTLVAKAGEIDADCMELTSYEKLFSTFQLQVKEGINELVLHVNSGGGSAFSCFEMANEVKQLAKENNIKIYAFVDGLSASAAYAWTSIADEVIARQGSEVGSVGVVVQLINNSKMLENIGLTRTFIVNGEQKVPFEANGEFSQQFLSNIQKKVDKTGLEFNQFVANNRGIDVARVISTQAEVFDTDEALSVGFIDKVMTRSEFFNDYLPSKSQTISIFNLNTSTTGKNMKTVEQLTTELEDANASLSVANATIESKDKELNTLTESLTAEQSAKAELASEIETLKQSLKDEQEAKESLSAEIAKMKAGALAADRKAKLTEVLGSQNEQLDTLLTTTASLDDAAFSAIVSAMSTKIDKEDQEMNEIGQKGKEQKMDSDPFSDALKKSIQRNS